MQSELCCRCHRRYHLLQFIFASARRHFVVLLLTVVVPDSNWIWTCVNFFNSHVIWYYMMITMLFRLSLKIFFSCFHSSLNKSRKPWKIIWVSTHCKFLLKWLWIEKKWTLSFKKAFQDSGSTFSKRPNFRPGLGSTFKTSAWPRTCLSDMLELSIVLNTQLEHIGLVFIGLNPAYH